MTQILTEARAAAFARIALGHVEREYPNHLAHVLDGPEDARSPASLHPIFFGSFDWHSCVHGYWLLARLLRRFPALAPADEIRALFDRRLTAGAVASEAAYFARPAARGFERPYGWAWLLKLAAELKETPWGQTLAPLTQVIAARFAEFLPKATYPVRGGAHYNSAFALALAHDYAAATGDEGLRDLLARTAERWFHADRDARPFEPDGDAFLSPTLMEAECLRRLLPPTRWQGWFDAFLPDLGRGEPATLFRPATVSDRSDGKIAHLDGLNLSRAWCWRTLAQALPDRDPRRPRMEAAAAAHLDAALDTVAGDYMGEHWLASFAVLALDG